MDAVEQRLRALAAYCASYPQVGLEDSVVSEHLAACLREVRAVTNLSQQKCQDVQAFLQSATLPGPVKSGLKEALMEQLARSEAGRLDSARNCACRTSSRCPGTLCLRFGRLSCRRGTLWPPSTACSFSSWLASA